MKYGDYSRKNSGILQMSLKDHLHHFKINHYLENKGCSNFDF